jgi:hypothetical protein
LPRRLLGLIRCHFENAGVGRGKCENIETWGGECVDGDLEDLLNGEIPRDRFVTISTAFTAVGGNFCSTSIWAMCDCEISSSCYPAHYSLRGEKKNVVFDCLSCGQQIQTAIVKYNSKCNQEEGSETMIFVSPLP